MKQLAARKAAKTGLTSPERAVLLAYSKIMLYDALLASKVPDDPYVSTALVTLHLIAIALAKRRREVAHQRGGDVQDRPALWKQAARHKA